MNILKIFGNLPVNIEQSVLRWVEIDTAQRNCMGADNCSLGVNMTIGERVLDRAGKFNLRLGRLNFEQFKDFLPTGQYYDTLHELIKILLIDQLDFDVVLILKRAEVPSMRLSEKTPCRLGWSGWVGDIAEDEVVILSGK